jgi:epsilon-lactone hydrolase
MRAAMRCTVRPVLGPRLPVGLQRCALDLLGSLPPVADGVTATPGTLGGRPVHTLVPRGAPGGRTVLYLHGGGFTTGSARTHGALASHLAAAAGATVHLLEYRLAPEHPYPAPLDDVLAAWRELLARGADPADTALAGDSAGGWLALTAALRLRDAGERLPAALGLISPWLDLSGGSWPDRPDAMLRPSWLHRCAADLAPGSDLSAVEFAPLRADLTGLPPVVVHAGSEEILLPDTVALARRARAAGVPVEARRFDGLWHVAQTSAGLVPDATTAVTAMGAALAARLPRSAGTSAGTAA